jgi:hypothetical protein
MRRLTTSLMIATLVSTAFIFSEPGLAQDISIQRFAIGGKKSIFDHYWSLNLDCSSTWMDVKMTKSPENGEAHLKEGAVVVSYSATNPHVRCNGKSTKGMVLEFTPSKGYTGKDSIEVELINEAGQHSTFTYDITVK